MTYNKMRVLLADAESLIAHERQSTYGDAVDTARRVGMAWAAILGLGDPIPPYQVQAMMASLKLVRAAKNPDHYDSWLDGVAYMALGHDAVAL